jgi:hypothetical protein
LLFEKQGLIIKYKVQTLVSLTSIFRWRVKAIYYSPSEDGGKGEPYLYFLFLVFILKN